MENKFTTPYLTKGLIVNSVEEKLCTFSLVMYHLLRQPCLTAHHHVPGQEEEKAIFFLPSFFLKKLIVFVVLLSSYF